MNSDKLFQKDFTLVVLGQIISLFGNAIIRFALPLYILNQTGSAALFGVVSAIAFIPMILLTPVGGIFTDRMNKRNIMVVLDFTTAAILTIFTLLLWHMDIVLLILITLILLYAIAGAYQPAVQASIPALASPEQLMPANAVINLVSSLATLIGPVIGGAIYGFYGLYPILYIGIACFLISAIMELFIKIPFVKLSTETSIMKTVVKDLKLSMHFISKEQPVIAKSIWIIAAFNMFLSSLIIIGIPVIVTQRLGFPMQLGNQLYGYAEGCIAAGSLLGGILTGVFGKKLNVKNAYLLLFADALTLIPIGFALMFSHSAMLSYSIILICCFAMMVPASIFSIQMLSYVQLITPPHLIGKIISCVMAVCLCASPIGQAMYGWVFQSLPDMTAIIFLIGAFISCLISLWAKSTFAEIKPILSNIQYQNS